MQTQEGSQEGTARLPDARVAAHERERAGHHAAAQHAAELRARRARQRDAPQRAVAAPPHLRQPLRACARLTLSLVYKRLCCHNCMRAP